MSIDAFSIPGAAWTHHFNEPLDQVKGASRKLSLGMLFKMAPMIFRLMRYAKKRKEGGFDPINMTSPETTGPYQGVPLGGLGCGSIGRGWRGEFRRWTLRPGYISNAPVWADQFSAYVRREGDTEGKTRVLFPGRPDDNSLSAWQWGMPPADGTYRALFPRAWTTYDNPLPDIHLTCRQLSPVIAHNYCESSLPVAEFRWKIENTGEEAAEVGLMFTFQNGMGQPGDLAGGHANQPFQFGTAEDGIRGIMLKHNYCQQEASETKPAAERVNYSDPLTFAIAGRIVNREDVIEAGSNGQVRSQAGGDEITYRARFVTSSSGDDVWQDFRSDGRLDNQADQQPSAPGESIGAALAITVQVPPGMSREVAFSLAWDMPIARVGSGRAYTRRYSRFYGVEGLAAQHLAQDALLEADLWEKQIAAWQSPILSDEKLPAWYRCALFNELYYLVDGGTIWAYPVDGQAPDAEMGHFAYLEGHEYRMYNTYDVHFYASWALIQLWPKIELALQRDIAAATLAEYDISFKELYTGKTVPRKCKGAVPHDVGWPDEDPWRLVNGYFLHDVNDWKDLNSKFVLQVYRDYLATGDRQFVCDTWEAVEEAIRRLNRFDRDGDGMIENDGHPDQTYDVWPVRGPSAYTGGLWLACLQAGAKLAEVVGELELASAYETMFEKGQEVYESRLWNGRYYNYDSSRSRQHDSIMADQMAGQWYARACGLPPVVNPQRAKAALSTVFDWNVMRFNNGQMGAVNGMRPDGTVDRTSMQSQEVWTGTTYAAAAAMIQEGMPDSGFNTAYGVYRMTYEKTGYWFQTPEAWDPDGNFRAIAYMRPLCVWAMQWALERKWEHPSKAAQENESEGNIFRIPEN
jgi:non-lysosomal glucosylceramidase